ncbi:MAG: DUF255 domain-containing protein [Bacteroidota bacterium]
MKYGYYLLTLLLLLFWGNDLVAQTQIEWLSIEAVEQKLKQQPRKVLVKIYTENCTWCKRMDEETFNKSFVADYINQHFYAIALNAETDEEISFNGRTYKFVKTGKRGYHELAEELTKGNLSYPSVAFLDESLKILQSVSGYKEYDLFQQIMTYYGKNYHKKLPWSSYQNTFTPRNK